MFFSEYLGKLLFEERWGKGEWHNWVHLEYFTSGMSLI